MLRAARLLRGVSPFSIFLMDQKNNPSLQGVSISKRGKMLSKMYKELSKQQRRDLQKRAQVHPSLRKAKASRPPRKTEFAEFVRKNYKVVQGLNYRKRFSALSQLYELHKPIEVQVAKAIKEAKEKKLSSAKKVGSAKKVNSAKMTVKKAAAKRKTAKGTKTKKSTSKKSARKK